MATHGRMWALVDMGERVPERILATRLGMVWHAHIRSGETLMRPGISAEASAALTPKGADKP
jgi:hypothetical protein